eukprot:CAMPEP_0201932720 /NCGR_PEP_ID=MMETSP0903-20130614/30096_1 /ASSEMBLY_ACC=CAM_ASM_000552 /TAXON_ID=420261 /ORGANISM="Thalassiosira antarctica, Strain CCMP982" /LENGTH=140 /DNA_ID=CAMNT_0048472427 /DNA_START=324 /DNA_END=744 /DNA_ORIENTATION=+
MSRVGTFLKAARQNVTVEISDAASFSLPVVPPAVVPTILPSFTLTLLSLLLVVLHVVLLPSSSSCSILPLLPSLGIHSGIRAVMVPIVWKANNRCWICVTALAAVALVCGTAKSGKTTPGDTTSGMMALVHGTPRASWWK